MSEYLDESAHAELAADAAAGRAVVRLPRTVAKQFFLRVSLSDIKTRSGRSVWPYKAGVLVGQILAPALLIGCFVLIYAESEAWLSALLVPLAGILWTVIAGFINADGHWLPMTIMVALAAGLAALGLPWAGALTVFTASLWVHRMTFVLAERSLTSLVTTSYAAYEMLTEHITVERTTAG